MGNSRTVQYRATMRRRRFFAKNISPSPPKRQEIVKNIEIKYDSSTPVPVDDGMADSKTFQIVSDQCIKLDLKKSRSC